MVAYRRIRAQPRAGRRRGHSLSWAHGHHLLRLRARAPAARALPRHRVWLPAARRVRAVRTPAAGDQPGRPELGNRSEEHTSELQSLMRISYAVFCLKKKKYTIHSETYDTQ